MTIYFYKVDQPYGCFSNFSPHPINCDGKIWLTVEHYYQAHKFYNSCDQWLMEKIYQVPTPQEAAAIGRNPDHKIRDDWEEVKSIIMEKGVLIKFQTHLDLKNILLATKEEFIIENSPKDYYWGCGKDGTGRNELGRILMKIRAKLNT
jgi:N-glycosidase YbiA